MPAAKTGTASRDLTAELAFLTRALKAPTLRESVNRLAERARAESWSHEEYLAACLQREVAARDAHGGESRIKAARFPARKSLEEFDFDHARGLKRDQVAHLGTLDFVAARENVIFLGPPGTGKTHLAIGLGIRACQAGHRVMFATASQWVDRLAEARVRSAGTNLGKLGGFAPATNKRFVAEQSHWYRVAGGKLCEHWATRDDLAAMLQMGVIRPLDRHEPAELRIVRSGHGRPDPWDECPR
jgi:hypothetical protein